MKIVDRLLKIFAVVCSLTLTIILSSNVYADEITKGVRGPTLWQIDDRIIYNKTTINVEATTNNFILKYWDGDGFGKWGFVSLPYKFINSQKGTDDGLGDMAAGFGPRGRIDNYHYFLYGAVTFPTGDTEKKNALGNGRYDARLAWLSTYFIADKRFEIDWIIEYTYTGENKKRVNPPDEIYIGGPLIGGKITDRIIFITGVTDLIKDNGDFLLNSSSHIRYTVSKGLHFQLVGNFGIDNKNIPKGNGVSLFIRINF
ncbi:MAG TPA: hypothetical protein DCY98_09365 [Nitrospinae bacterium]|nr:hypothetical protein [Nitrospinota bacterium]